MKNFRNETLSFVRMGEDGDGEGGEEKTVEQKIADAVQAAREEAAIETQGLKANAQKLLEEKKAAEKAMKKFEGLDVDGLLDLKKKVEEDDILKLHSEGKHSEAYDKMMEKERVTFNAAKEAYESQIEELRQQNEGNSKLVDDLLIGGGAKSSFTKANGLKDAVETVDLLAKQVWKVENGVPVARDEKGEMLQGEKGPMQMDEWAEGLKKSHPYLFPASETGGANGGDGNNSGSKSIEQQIIDAANSGKHNLVRELRKQRDKR